MATNNFPIPLRKLLMLDAVTCVVMGAALVATAPWLAGFTAIPAALLFYAGLALMPIAAFMAFIALRPTMPPAAVAAIVLGNVLWVIGSVGLLLGPWITPNAIGYAFIGVQAIAVAGLAALEGMALPRSAQSLSMT